MQLRKQSSNTCMQYSLAMALDLPPEVILNLMPEENDFFGHGEHRSPHITELIECARVYGHAMLTIPYRTLIDKPGFSAKEIMNSRTDWTTLKGVIDTTFQGRRHFVAYEDGMIYDPKGMVVPITDSRYSHNFIHPMLGI